MRHVALLAPAVLAGGCSLLYNPSNLDKAPVTDARVIDMGEVAVDVEIRADANPIDMELTEAFPPTINEGAGTGGARASVVVVRGKQFVKDASANLMVTLAPATVGALTLDSFEVSGNGDYIALVLTVPVTDTCEDGASVPVAVTVKQNDGAGGTVMKTLDNAFAVTCLDQLTAAPTATTNLRELYSKIDISGPITITPADDKILALRSASSITVGNITASASGRSPGPGGGKGGLAGVEQPGGPAPGANGPAGTGNGGGGAGYVVAGTTPSGGGTGGGPTGDVWISNFTSNRASGGGAGATISLGGTPGIGGGGGGTVELTAQGTLTVGTITANGSPGAAGTGTIRAGDGAGGAGGTVLLRTFAGLTAGAVSVTPGGPGTPVNGSTNAGTSSAGRVRADAAMGTYPTNAQKGPMLVDVPAKVTVQTPAITLRGTTGDATATLRVFDRTDAVVGNNTYTPVFGGGSPATATVMPVLHAGYNRVCVWVVGGLDTIPESANCTTIAYLPP